MSGPAEPARVYTESIARTQQLLQKHSLSYVWRADITRIL